MAAPEVNRSMLRLRDAIDRNYGSELDLVAMSGIANISPAHLIRTFRAVFGETPHRYLQRRRVERAMFLLRSSEELVTDICFAVGFGSLGTFSRTFREIVGESPSSYRSRSELPPAPGCFTMAWTRPASFAPSSSFGEAPDRDAP
jgi:AraC-like DNA-binding protein